MTEQQTLHFNLSHLPVQEGLQLHANLQAYALTPHTLATRRQAGQHPDLLHGLPTDSLTHFIEGLAMPASRAALVYLTQPAVVDGQKIQQLVSMKISLPKAGEAAARARREAARQLDPDTAEDGERPADFEPSGGDVDPANIQGPINQLHIDTAVALLFHHPNLLNLNEDGHALAAADIIDIITKAIGYDSLALPRTIADLKTAWRTSVPLLDEEQPDGSQSQMTGPGANPGDPPVLLFRDELHPRVKAAMQAPLKYALKKVQDMPSLRGQQWTVQHGVAHTAQSTHHLLAGQIILRGTDPANPYRWKLNNLTPSPGLIVSPDVRFEALSQDDDMSWYVEREWGAGQLSEASRLTAELIESFVQGKMQLVVANAAHSQGFFRASLVPEIGLGGTLTATLELRDGQPDEPGATFSATVTLDAKYTKLTYLLGGQRLGANASATLCLVNADGTSWAVHDLGLEPQNSAHYDGVLHVTCANHWLRHLGAYVQFSDGNDQPIQPTDWSETLPSTLRYFFQRDATKLFLAMVPPITMLCGIPMEAEPTELRIPIPRGTEKIRLLWGGLGQGDFDSKVCWPGIVMTAVMEMALPVALLIAGAASGTTHDVKALLNDRRVLFSILAVGSGVAAKWVDDKAERLGSPEIPLIQLGNIVGPFLLKTGLKQYLLIKAGEGAAIRSIPFVNLAFQVYGAIVTVSNLARTTVAVLQSPFYYQTEISRSIDVEVELTPDPLFHLFPAQARRYKVIVAYDTAATTVTTEGELEPKAVLSDPIRLLFTNMPAGGRLKVTAFMYAANGWQAGQGESGWFRAEGDENATLHLRDVQVHNNLPPLDATSVYAHQGKLAYRASRHVWLAGAAEAPTATPTTAVDSSHQIIRWESITLAQAPAALGYCWQATGLNLPRDSNPTGDPVNDAMYAVQSISILEDPELGYATPQVGYGQLPGLVYDLRTTNDGDGSNFFIEGKSNGEFHLRRLRPAFDFRQRRVVPPVFPAPGATESWGCFPKQLDRYVVHPQGRIIGISNTDSKLFICQLPPAGRPDEQAPKASLASGEGTREGLMKSPIALTVGLDGAVLVLENNRVQAFDLHGNPVLYFRDPQHADQKSSTLPLAGPTGTQYLDLAVEGKGYLYVLSRRGANSPLADYQLNIYTPDGELLVATPRMVAGRLTVGLNRNVYTLNYEVFEGPNGRTEPSVSLWVPPAPSG